MTRKFDGTIITLILFIIWIVTMIIMLSMGLSSCTCSISLVNNHGYVDDLIDNVNDPAIDLY